MKIILNELRQRFGDSYKKAIFYLIISTAMDIFLTVIFVVRFLFLPFLTNIVFPSVIIYLLTNYLVDKKMNIINGNELLRGTLFKRYIFIPTKILCIIISILSFIHYFL
jgi:hypothetical protein